MKPTRKPTNPPIHPFLQPTNPPAKHPLELLRAKLYKVGDCERLTFSLHIATEAYCKLMQTSVWPLLSFVAPATEPRVRALPRPQPLGPSAIQYS